MSGKLTQHFGNSFPRGITDPQVDARLQEGADDFSLATKRRFVQGRPGRRPHVHVHARRQ